MPPMRVNDSRSEQSGQGPDQPTRVGLSDVIAETEALRNLLHDAYARACRLLAALKQQKRQARAVQEAMRSLQDLDLGR
jgi:hypothetical protein